MLKTIISTPQEGKKDMDFTRAAARQDRDHLGFIMSVNGHQKIASGLFRGSA